jgi:hypothetical protein
LAAKELCYIMEIMICYLYLYMGTVGMIILNNNIQTIQWPSEKEENGNNKRNVEKTLHTENKIKQHKPN